MRGGNFLDYPGGTNLITAALKNRELFPVMVRKRYDDRRKAKDRQSYWL